VCSSDLIVREAASGATTTGADPRWVANGLVVTQE
jgi:hypothetical protein